MPANRALTLSYSGNLVTSVGVVGTDGANSGSWTYGYAGNVLTSVCAPGQSGAVCTSYNYTGQGNHYITNVLDDSPVGYWKMDGTGGLMGNAGLDFSGTNHPLDWGLFAGAGNTTTGALNGACDTSGNC